MSLGGVTAYFLGGVSAMCLWRFIRFFLAVIRFRTFVTGTFSATHVVAGTQLHQRFQRGTHTHTHAKTDTITGIHGAITQFIVARRVER